MKTFNKLLLSLIFTLGIIITSSSNVIALEDCVGPINNNGQFREQCTFNGVDTYYHCLYGKGLRDETRFGTTNYICPDEFGSYEWAVNIAPPMGSGVNPASGSGVLNFNVQTGPTNATFDALNPLKVGNSGNVLADDLSTPSGIINRALRYLFPLAGLILFVMLVWGGFEILSTASTKKSIDAGKQRAQAAIIGFILLFTSYWIIQIIQAIFAIKIL